MSALPLLAVATEIRRPTVFLPGFGAPEELASGEALILRLRDLAGGRPMGFAAAYAAYPEFKPFPAITVSAGGGYLCTVADRWPSEGDQLAALAELRRRA